MRTCFGAAAVLAAKALLTTACAAVSAFATPPPGTAVNLSYQSLPASTLVSRRDLQFQVAQVPGTDGRTTVLAYRPPGGQPTPVATITASGSGQDARVVIRQLPLPVVGVDERVLHVTVLEHLYGLTMRQDPEGRFCFADGNRTCDPRQPRRTHADALRAVAAARAQALAGAGHAIVGAPWASVSLSPAAVRGSHQDEVSARVALGQEPLPKARLFFNRAPHSSCSATSDVAGVATCVLVDQHGDDGDDADVGAVPVSATFPGSVAADRVLLPTTMILKGGQ